MGHAAPTAGGALTIATFPLLDEIVRAAIPASQRLHPDVEIKIINRQYADHHTAMTTALSTVVLLPDMMALESSFVGRYAQGQGLEDLSREPYRVDRFRSHLVGYAYDQAVSRSGAVVAVPRGANTGYGGAFYAMPRRADPSRKALAWRFIQLMTLDRTRQLAAFKSHDAFPALLATHEDEFFEQPVAFLGGQKARLLWREAARRISASPVHKQINFADEAVGTERPWVMRAV